MVAASLSEKINNRKCFEIQGVRVQRTAKEITDRKRLPWKFADVRRGQRELEPANAKLWLAEHFKQS